LNGVDSLPVTLAGENMMFWPLRKFFKRFGAVSFDRNSKNRVGLIKKIVEIIKRRDFFFFAQPGRTYTPGFSDLGEFKSMFFASVTRAQEVMEKECQVIPVHVRYSKRIEDRSYGLLKLGKKIMASANADGPTGHLHRVSAKLKYLLGRGIYLGTDFVWYSSSRSRLGVLKGYVNFGEPLDVRGLSSRELADATIGAIRNMHREFDIGGEYRCLKI